jgi:hypothetical protein
MFSLPESPEDLWQSGAEVCLLCWVLHHVVECHVSLVELPLQAPADLSKPQSTYFYYRDETGSVYLPTQLERTLQLYW